MAGAFDYFKQQRPIQDYAWEPPQPKTTQDEWGNYYDDKGNFLAEPYSYDEHTPTGIFSKAFGMATGIDTPERRRAKTPWGEAAWNTAKAFLPYTNERGSIIPDAVYGLKAPVDFTGKVMRGEKTSEREQAEAMLGTIALGGLGKGLTAGSYTPFGRVGQTLGLKNPLGWAGEKMGLADPYITGAADVNPINAGDYARSAFKNLTTEPDAIPPDMSSAKLAWRYGADLNTDRVLQRDATSPALQEAANKTGQQFFANGDEKSAALGAFLNNQTPFYGESVGPKGRIADPAAAVERLGLKSGLADAPADGFFNPATSALMQDGVAPKQTVTYYAKQMGSRGGKLPPGMWEKATEGLAPDEVIPRDELVRRIDALAPQFDKRAFFGSEDVDYNGARDLQNQGSSGPAQYENWATKGPFENYKETVVGYADPHGQPREGHTRQNMVGAFDDTHFDHPNLEGWYRTQDANTLNPRHDVTAWNSSERPVLNTRILEEMQPQRYQKMRDLGEGMPQEQMIQLSKERDRAHADIDLAKKMIRKHETDALALELDPENPFDIQRVINDPSDPRSAKLKAAQDEVIKLKQDIVASQNRIRDIDGKIQAGKKGVAKSPYSHDVNASTDFLLKSALNDATKDGVNRIAWTPGEAQAARYNQALQDVKGLRYDPESKQLYMKRGEGRDWLSVKSGVKPEELPDYVGADVAKRLLAQPRKYEGAMHSVAGPHTIEFPEGMTLGGEGMKGYYGSGPRGEGGILTGRIKSLWQRIMGDVPKIEPQSILTGKPSPLRNGEPPKGGAHYPSVELPDVMREKIKKTGLSLFANGDEKSAFLLNHGGQYEMGLDPPASAFTSKLEPRQLNEGFYSALDEAMGKIQRKQGPAQGWINDLKKAGVKDQEIYWRGLDDFLKSKGNSPVTKEEIQNHLNANKVKIWSAEHDQDGMSVDDLRESMRDHASEDASYYAAEHYKADLDEDVITEKSKRYKIEPEDDGTTDMFSGDAGKTYRVIDTEDPDNVEPLQDGLSQKEAERFVREKAIEDADEYGDLYALYDHAGNKIEEGFGSEDHAMERAQEIYTENEINRIDEMSDAEILRENDASLGENTSGYIEGEAPGKLDNYRESVLGVNPETLARKGSPGWTSSTGMKADGIHPDSHYEHSPGWRLESDYVDLADPTKSGTAVHEVQSRWHARGADKGWKSSNPEEIAKLEGAFRQEASKFEEVNTGAYQRLDNGDMGLIDLAKLNQDEYLGGGGDVVQTLIHRVRRVKNELEEAKRELPYWEKRAQDSALSEQERRYHSFRAERYKALLEESQRRLPEAEAQLEDFKKKYVIETIPQDSIKNPTGDTYSDAAVRYFDWKKALDDQKLRYNEAESRYKAAKEGVSPGPFVGEKSDIMAFLLKHGLYNSALKGEDFFAVQGPERMKDRWGDSGPHEDYGRIDPKTGKQAAVIPMTLQKLARMHDPKAVVEQMYPGNSPKAPSGAYAEPRRIPGPNENVREPGLPMPELTDSSSGGFTARSQSRISGVALHQDPYTGEPVYVLKVPGGYLGQHGQPAYDVNSHYNGPVKFKSKAAAERAMEKINSDLEWSKTNKPSPEEAFQDISSNPEPFWAIRWTPELRDSVKKRGFPMFANGDEKAAFLAGMLPQTQELAKAGGFDLSRPMFHGTTHDLTGGFLDPKDRANWSEMGGPGYERQSFHGPAIYASSSQADSAMNYLDNGPDLRNRILGARDWGKTEEEARAALTGGNPQVIPLLTRAQNLLKVNTPGRMNARYGEKPMPKPKPPEKETAFEYDSGYNPDTDEYGNPSGSGIELLTAMEKRLKDTGLSPKESSQLIADVEGAMMDDGRLTASEFEKIIRNSEHAFGLIDGDYGSPGNLLQHIYRDLGYEGIAHMNADTTFKGPGLPMAPGTTHYSFFDPEKMRAIGAAFDPGRRHESGLYYSNPGLPAGAFSSREDDKQR